MKDSLLSISGVKYVHNLRIWSLTTSKITMSVHLAIGKTQPNSMSQLSCALCLSLTNHSAIQQISSRVIAQFCGSYHIMQNLIDHGFKPFSAMSAEP